MPSLPANQYDSRPDFVLGDRFASSCDSRIVQFVERQLTAMGYVVMRNKPYSGGFITEHYGQPEEGLHALQIEIKRALYMNENTFTKKKRFALVRRDLRRLCKAMFEYVPELLKDRPAAAE
jgi:N-formylglutamate amidohydrolase